MILTAPGVFCSGTLFVAKLGATSCLRVPGTGRASLHAWTQARHQQTRRFKQTRFKQTSAGYCSRSTALQASMESPDTGAFKQWRLELYFKSNQELTDVACFLKQHGVQRINITNKVWRMRIAWHHSCIRTCTSCAELRSLPMCSVHSGTICRTLV